VRWTRSATLVLLVGLAGPGCAIAPPESPALSSSRGDRATGVVFDDENRNGVLDPDEHGISDVAVSNGRDLVLSDQAGRYSLPVPEEAILFVIKPRGWMTPIDDDGIPLFAYAHKPLGSPPQLRHPGLAPTGPLPESVDFPLHPSEEPEQFSMILFGDTQPYTLEEVDFVGHSVVEELIGSNAAFGMTLGDVVGDDLSLFAPLNRTIGRIGIPWYNVHGNHDVNLLAENDLHSDETWERVYGPTTYAFQWGSVHFIVLDNVIYAGANLDGSSGGYSQGLTPRALEFVRGYLALVPEDEFVVLAMHIPLSGRGKRGAPERRALLEAISGHPHTLSLSAHTHFQSQHFFGAEDGYTGSAAHHHLNHATVSGSWWLGERDLQGIPHATMRDGTPNGYSWIDFDGNDYTVRFKVARRPMDHQLTIHAPDAIQASKSGDVEVVVNVFAGNERTRVEMRLGEDGAWTSLQREPGKDPFYVALRLGERASVEASRRRALPPPVDSSHRWVGQLPTGAPTGTHLIEVRVTDMFGANHVAHRLIRVE
jgi:hypothetical protein